jgi:hypothetical protein
MSLDSIVSAPVYASPADVDTYRADTVRRDPADPRPLLRFDGRLGTDEHPSVALRFC